MAAEKTRSSKTAKQETGEVMFKCGSCGKEKPISEMKPILRFRPAMIVCRDCEKTIR